jgi:DMSO/TMAO reductase YedYZ heme-binding membrane subunit
VNSGTTLWYLTRGSGVVSLLLLTATTLAGVMTAGRWRSDRWPRFAVTALHRNLTLLALVFIGVHVGTTIADGYAPIGIKDAFIPFLSAYRPVWLGFGALTFDLLLALTITSLLRKHIGYRTWRALHWAAYAAWPLALVHGLGSGSDARFGWMAAIAFGSLAFVVIAIAVRLFRAGRPDLQLVSGAAVVALVIIIGAWYGMGPSKRGWAAKAGTPSTLLKSNRTVATRRLASAPVVRPVSDFTGSLVGHMSSSGPNDAGDAAIAIAAAVRGREPGVVHLTVWGTALEGGGLRMSDSSVSFADEPSGAVYTGTIVGLNGPMVEANVTSPAGKTLRLVMNLRLDGQAGTVDGSIRGSRQDEKAAQ